MAKEVKHRRGTTAEAAVFTGAVAEITVDTTKHTTIVHDGSTAGGFPQAREDLSNAPAFVGATSGVNGAAGKVPAPVAGDQTKALFGDGTWKTVASGSVTSVNGDSGPAVVLDADDISDTSTTKKFTTAADISKLAGIEANATADQTAEEIEAAYNMRVGQVTDPEITAGTETEIRRYAPVDIVDFIVAHAAAGPQGPAGEDGADGADGADGKTILNGIVAPTTEGVDGDFYIDTLTDTIYGPKAAGVWGSGTSLIGPQGPAGADGNDGAPGVDGDDGAPGADGADGIDGKTILNGIIAPTTEGVDGDFYIDTATDTIYGPKTAGAWGTGTSLIGPAGADGNDGAPGAAGNDGADGTDGTDGVDGRTILSGIVAPTTEGADGDFYIDTVTSTLYGPKTTGAWGSGTSLIGPAGADGTDGADGETGATGAPGAAGADGDSAYQVALDNGFVGDETAWLASLVGPTGAAGADGEDGAPGTPGTDGDDGAPGADGADGRTILSGTVAPTTEGEDGDFYINTATSMLYGPKTTGAWGSGTSLIGAPGADGADGIDGEDGAPGATGSAGADGKTVRNGTVAPTTEGVDGDFYINTATNLIYGPKTSGAWGSGTSIVGPAGSTGAAGADGKTVLNGTVAPTTEGVNGDFYINTATNLIYGPKTGGAWGSGTSLVGPQGPTGSTPLTQFANNTNTSYTLALTDQEIYLRFTNAAAKTVTVPTNASVAFPFATTGTSSIYIVNAGAGTLTLAAAGGVTFNKKATLGLTLAQWGVAVLTKVNTNEWDLSGDLDPAP